MKSGAIFISKSGKEFVFALEESGCSCGKCAFNEMGYEGDNLCAEAPDCYDDEDDDWSGHYILKSNETN